MVINPSPREIITALLPHLRVAAGYARHLQSQINSLPDKDAGDNLFTAALTDADISIQTLIEVAILGTFPNMRFYGEEYEKSHNTKYFRSIELGEQDDYLITLDPIDGTKLYLDGSDNYLIILSVLNADEYEAVMTISPANNSYWLTFRGEGIYQGDLDKDLDACTPLKAIDHQPTILLGWGLASLKPPLDKKYHVIDLEHSYIPDKNFPNYKNMFSGDLIGWATKRGKFIDSAALAFMAKEAGYIVTDLVGLPLVPLSSCENYSYEGIVVGVNREVHQDLLAAVN
ncbi:Inositol monophosphatase/fructose-1,6-bisphosphatase family protein [Hyella patelloides LEGE 07179]|uniref:Inositol monophosphatase/fructose-1,6-bisphosphatase family protein n=1 Tax=Hyella patelloides LEGE 07179 TaxID=945734 RepID=A0A563VJZ0_9CYAN|nr:inositol monophosphatase family protein [Hyella patelloides]VEP11780.1 Inositol monophosphatase/fructose-1,6-bisphosphatase family protein [Hyella patelloides LEGE 07179]